jgi:hypothetical protein
MRFLLPYGAVVSLALCFSSTASADSYTLTKIADTSDGFFFGTSPPSINNQGTVAFRALLSGNPALGFGVFTGQGGSVDLIADASGPLSGFVSSALSINDAGIVSFIAGLDPPGGVGIFAGSGGPLIPIVETGGRFSNVGFVQPINDAGTVAFRAFEPGVGSGVFIGQGESITNIAQVTSSVGSVTEDVSINNGGTVAFTGAGLPGFGLVEGLFTGTGGPLTLIADTTGPFRGQFQPSINNNGDIAFRAALDTGGFGLFMYSGGSFTTVADTNGAFDFFAAQPPSNPLMTSVAWLLGRAWMEGA